MDKLLLSRINKVNPKPNPLIAGGYTSEQVKHAEEYIDRVMRSTTADVSIGLKYLGSRRCTPKEEYRILIDSLKGRKKKPTFELSPTDTFLMAYDFEYEGEIITSHMLLPYVRDGGFMRMRNSRFFISPVLVARSVSVKDDTVFIPITKAKLNFKRMIYHVIRDGDRLTTPIIYSRLHHFQEANRKENAGGKLIVFPHWSMAHYMFCRFGMKETFKGFLNVDIVVGDNDITEDTYPSSDWTIFKSTQIQPKETQREKFYIPSEVKIAIRTKDVTNNVMMFVTSAFYAIDHYPDRITAETAMSPWIWKVTLGYTIFQSATTEAKLVEDVETHLNSIEKYIDEKSHEELASDGIFVNNMYDLFMYVINNMETIIQTYNPKSLYNKRLVVLRYLLSDLVSAISNMTFKLNSAKKKLTIKDVSTTIRRYIRPEKIFEVRRVASGHNEISTIDTPGDNLLFKATTSVVQQTRATGSRKHANDLKDDSILLDASLAEVGSYLFQPKSNPCGRARLNMYLDVDEHGLIRRKKHLAEMIDGVQKLIDL